MLLHIFNAAFPLLKAILLIFILQKVLIVLASVAFAVVVVVA